MKLLFNPDVLKHPGNSSESADRLDGLTDIPPTSVERDVAEKAIRDLYHNNRLNIRKILAMCKNNSRIAETQLSKGSYDAIIASVSLAIQAMRSSDFALTRPPGHHASLYTSQGFCLINNLAVAVNQLILEGKKVCIIDIDGHHGNGTQDIFAGNEQILFCSFHQQGAFPSLKNKKSKKNEQNIVSISVPEQSGDDVFELVSKRMISKAKEFSPDYIAISAGFDGFKDDPLLSLNLTEHSYYDFGRALAEMGTPTFAVLEGGYHSKLKSCIDSLICGVNGEKFEFDTERTESPSAILNAVNIFS